MGEVLKVLSIVSIWQYAGTLIDAMNAAVLVSNVVNRKKSWEEAVTELENFWKEEGKGLSLLLT